MDVKQLSSFQDFSPEKLRKLNVFQSERFFLDVYCLAPGQAQKPHHHATSDKVYVVLDGRCRFRVGAEEEVHGVGAAVFAPAGAEHGVANDGPASARLLVLMTPPPEHA
ncbi:cupin domain-containing protein [Myxococcus sp. CA051A]|uniref:cupin domain-containing protein n=1 Tax=unclassified Myxococcus TaxID=2648731 RepID=UPI00157BA738|nr:MULTISPECIES: cupin domain-containing protein [unclassified Myxococcus]NTX34036.1 cupin domain-containing protein [Myxococcus sp. CA033]NTX65777.1 cupin domain-containing protein [Myxococcus sp. CA051A]